MHSITIGRNHFHYNSDLSGDVLVIVPVYDIQPVIDPKYREVHIDGQSLLEFVAEYVRLHRITEIENLSPAQVLGLGERLLG